MYSAQADFRVSPLCLSARPRTSAGRAIVGANVRKEEPILCEGDESFVLTRDRNRDLEESWSITVRPYRPKPTQDLLRDLSSSSSGCTCLLGGNRILLADGGSRPIENIRSGDLVMTMSGAARVQRFEETQLGMTRKIVELRGQGDECLVLSDDHPLWVSRRSATEATREWWGTYNLNHVLYEMRQMTGYELDELPVALNFDLPEQIAHVSGWLHVRPIYHHLPPETALYHLVVENAFSYIAEGFPVFSHCSTAQGPQMPWRGLSSVSASAQFVARVTATA